MAISYPKPISSLLSKLLKDTLTTLQIRTIADKYHVHYNTIINIRDRRKKDPNKQIL
jgi:transposase